MAKAKIVSDVMTALPVTLRADSVLADAAKAMRDSDIGDVIVLDAGKICGIVTDRDIVVRGLASDMDPASTPLRDVCSKALTTVVPGSNLDEAVELMREKAIRRLPVVEGGQPVGVLSLGDLAIERDPKSALADISEAPPNT
jgi:CBS domain-containing protein